jgi:hypothetical protein
MPIEQHAPALEHIVSRHQDIEQLASGFGGDIGPAEGPVWWKDGGYLTFSDIHHNRHMKWIPGVEGSRRSLKTVYSTVTCSMVTCERGRSLGSVGVEAMASTTSWPSMTRPKMV